MDGLAKVLPRSVACCLCLYSAFAQEPSEYRIRSVSELVVLDVSVEDRGGRHVAGLNKESFRLHDNGKLQPLHSFTEEDLPISVGLVIDQSGSMAPKQYEVLKACQAFIEMSNPKDEMFVVNFNDTARLGLPAASLFTSNPSLLSSAISSSRPQGRTALNDALILALNHLNKSRLQRKVLILISDGGDNASLTTEKNLLDKAAEVQAAIYSIGVFEDDDPDRNPALLRRLAALSGGEAYMPGQITAISQVMHHIAQDLRSHYSLSYVPVREKQGGELRRIKVQAFDRGRRLIVRARSVYKLPDLDGGPQ